MDNGTYRYNSVRIRILEFFPTRVLYVYKANEIATFSQNSNTNFTRFSFSKRDKSSSEHRMATTSSAARKTTRFSAPLGNKELSLELDEQRG